MTRLSRTGRVNEDQGADSTLSFQLAPLGMQSLEIQTAPQQKQEMSGPFEHNHPDVSVVQSGQ